VESYDAAGVIPTYSLAMGSGQPALARRDLPGVSSTDLATANALLATLGGYVDGYSQTFNVTSRSSGYVANAPFLRHFLSNDYSFYAQDKWKLLPESHPDAGPALPVARAWWMSATRWNSRRCSGTAEQTLLSNATLNFAGLRRAAPGTTARWKDFAPNYRFRVGRFRQWQDGAARRLFHELRQRPGHPGAGDLLESTPACRD
jgi:hypothetical protein